MSRAPRAARERQEAERPRTGARPLKALELEVERDENGTYLSGRDSRGRSCTIRVRGGASELIRLLEGGAAKGGPERLVTEGDITISA